MIPLASHPDYRLRVLASDEFKRLRSAHEGRVFGAKPRLDLDELLSAGEQAQIARLRGALGAPLVLRLGLFHADEFVGWHIGEQSSATEFYMRNSGILPAYRRRGLYTAMIARVLCDVSELGFQVVTSRHTAVNNAVIIPKLKLGFVITGIEVSDQFGTLVKLSYFTNPMRREVLAFRCGERQADDEIKHLLGLST
jgi:ribosomal protein S18 acetylase RimI-like enzyme